MANGSREGEGSTAARAARALGLSYRKTCKKDAITRYLSLPELRRASTFKHLMTGTWGERALCVLECTFLVFTGQVSVPVVHTVITCEIPDWPSLTVRPRKVFGRLLYRLGHRPGLHLDDPHFNRRFRVDAEDEDFAILILSPEVQSFMLEKTSVIWRINDRLLALVYRGSLRPKRLPGGLERLERLWNLLPPELDGWDRYEP